MASCCATALRADVRGDWDEAKQHDVLFLLTIRPPDANELAALRTAGEQQRVNPMELYGLTYVRGCEVIEVKDEGQLDDTEVAPQSTLCCDGTARAYLWHSLWQCCDAAHFMAIPHVRAMNTTVLSSAWLGPSTEWQQLMLFSNCRGDVDE